MANLNTQIKVGADSSGVATGLEPGKRALKDFGASADGAGKSLAGMGNGTAASAQKVEQATKSMIQSIQRTTAATEAGDKSTRAYQESLARMRGIDVAALKPYLDQLDAAKSKASLAATANASYASSFASIKTAALAAGAAIAAFGLFTKKINDGVDALNDLKDATGSSIENISALQDIAARTGTSFDTVGAAMIKFNKTLGDAKPGTDAVRVLEELGLSAKELKNIDPAEALLKTAKAFEKFADDGNKARAMEELFGKSTKEVAAYLKDLAEKSELVGTVTTQAAQEAEKFNKELFKLEKNALDLARSLTSSLIPALNQVFEDFRNFGPKMDLGSAASEVVRLNKELKGLKEIEVGKFNIFGGVTKQIAQVSKDLDAAKAKFNALDTARPNAAGDAAYEALEQRRLANRPTIKVPEKVDPAIAAAAKKAAADYNKELEDQAKLLAELSGLTGSFSKDWDRLSTIYKKGGLSLDGLTKAQADLLAKQPFMKAKHDAEVKASKIMQDEYAAELLVRKELSDAQVVTDNARTSGIQAVTAYADSIKEQNEYSRLELSLMGSSATAREIALGQYKVELDLKKQIEAIDSNPGFDADKKIEQRARARAAAAQSMAGVETKVYTDEWKKTSDGIQNTLTDALMRGFESGKDFARNLRDTVVNMFKTLVLRPIISAVINPVAGALTGALGLSGAAQAAGTGSSVLSSVGTIAGLASTFGAGLKAGFAGLMGEAGLMGTLSAGTTAIGAGNIAGGLGTLGGPLALATAAILGLSAIIKATSGETRNGAKYGVGTDGKAVKLEGPSGGEIAATQAQAMFNVAKSSIEGLLTGLGSKAVLTGFTAGLESSENGKGFAYATGQINGKSFGDVNTYMNSRGDKTQEQALKDYQLELTQSILEGLQVTEDIPASIAKLISDGLNGSEVKNLSLEATSAILANVETLSKQVNTFNAAMTQLPFASLTKLSFDTTAGLIAAAGGFEKLDANLSSYYANFYTAEEQRAQSITNTEAAFAALGLTMPALDGGARAAYRGMVELAAGQDLSIASNAKAYTGLLALQGPMNELAPAFATVADAAAPATAAISDFAANMQKVTDGLQSTGAGLQAQWDKLFLSEDAYRTKQITGMTALQVAQFDTNTSLQTTIDAFTAMAQVTTDLQASGAGLQAQWDKLYLSDDAYRAKQIVGMTDLQIAQYDANVSLQASIDAFDDVGIAAQKAADAARAMRETISGLLSSMVSRLAADVASAEQMLNTSRAGIKTAYDAESTAIKATQQRFTSIGKTFADFANGLASALDTPAQSFERLSAEYARLNDMARLGDTDAAAKAVSVGGQLKESIIARSGTREQAEREISKLANSATATAAIANTQASLADISLQQLDTQVSGFIDLNASVLSVKAAIEKFQADQSVLDVARNAHLKAVDLALSSQSIFATGGSSAAAQSYTLKEVSAALIDYFKNGGDASTLATSAQNNYGIDATTLAGAATTIAGTTPAGAANTAATTAANAATTAAARAQTIRDYITMAQATMSGATLAHAIYGKAMQVGTTQAEIAAAIGWSTSAVSDFFSGAGIPAFARGINYVPGDMTARIHEGEAVIPKAYNPFNPNAQQSSNSDTAAALRLLADRLDKIEANTRATAGHTAGTDRKLARVIPGNALITEAA